MRESTLFTPLLTTTDWNEEWVELQEVRERFDDHEAWDKRAKNFSVKHGSQEGYVARFIELMDVRDGDSVFDMGCGTGALATPLALAGHEVIACDFSQAMLDVMSADQRSLGVDGVDVKLMSWADDWNDWGIGPGCADIAIASRSIATSDLKESLLKLDAVARRRVCITLPSSASPRADSELLEAAGIPATIGRDFLYAFNILAQCGISPRVDYIVNSREDRFESYGEALDAYTDIVRAAVKGTVSESSLDDVPERLAVWLDEHLVESEGSFTLDHTRPVTWAFISWDK